MKKQSGLCHDLQMTTKPVRKIQGGGELAEIKRNKGKHAGGECSTNGALCQKAELHRSTCITDQL